MLILVLSALFFWPTPWTRWVAARGLRPVESPGADGVRGRHNADDVVRRARSPHARAGSGGQGHVIRLLETRRSHRAVAG